MYMPTQDDIFSNGEGDAWFERNQSYLASSEVIANDPVLHLLDMYRVAPSAVLEIGCSDGWRLAEIARRTPCRVVGVEPSAAAITHGKNTHPNVLFHQGIAAALPVEESFDLVIVNYVLHWIARDTLLQSIVEIDRVVKDGGFLLIGDFSPDRAQKNPYHHRPDQDMYTYKLDYPSIFVSTGLYRIVGHITFDHGTHEYLGTVEGDKRGACTLLRKSLSEFYL